MSTANGTNSGPDTQEQTVVCRQQAMAAAAEWKAGKEKAFAALKSLAEWEGYVPSPPKENPCVERMVAYLLQEREEEKKRRPLEDAIADLLEAHNVGSESDTPDWILAQYLRDCLRTWTTAITARNASIQGRGGNVSR